MHSFAYSRRVVLFLGVFILLKRFSVWADTLVTTNDERFVGVIISQTPQTIIFDSKSAGRITLDRSAVKEINQVSIVGPPKPARPDSVRLPFAPNDRFDWIQLKSGEWLKGKLKSLQDDKLEFDSEEMDEHKFEWKDIFYLRSPRLQSVRFENKETADGSLFISTNQVIVFDSLTTNTFARTDLIGIAPTGSREINKWSADLSVGISFRSGNTREVDYNARAMLQRRTPFTRLTFDYLGNYGSVNDLTTENNQRVALTYDLFLSRRLFLRLPDVEYYSDPLQNLQHRLTLGASVGYDLVHNKRIEWDVTAGPAIQRNWFVSVEENEQRIEDSAALVISSRLDVDITKRLELILEYRGQFATKNNTTHHATATLEYEIHKRFDLDISLVWDRFESPQTESSGMTPSTDDVRLIFGVGIKL